MKHTFRIGSTSFIKILLKFLLIPFLSLFYKGLFFLFCYPVQHINDDLNETFNGVCNKELQIKFPSLLSIG